MTGPSSDYFQGFDPALVPSPSFVVDKAALQRNLEILKGVMDSSGADILLALKGFSMFSLAQPISSVLSGTTASSLHEARLGKEEFGGQVHIYAPAYGDEEMKELLQICDHIVFNSFSEWEHHREMALAASEKRARRISSAGGKDNTNRSMGFGLRINPEHSEGTVPLYDPCAPFSRMGVTLSEFRPKKLQGINGLHFHTLCEQGAEPLERTWRKVEEKFGPWLNQMEWINLGGGHHITEEGYNRELLIELIREIRANYGLHVFLEPGEAIAIHTGILVSSVLDTPRNAMDLAILDTSATCHMPDTLEMPYRPDIWNSGKGQEKKHTYRLGGPSCLAGDVIGDYSFDAPLNRGDRLVFDDMAHYSMVKTTTFNGINLPSICTYDSRTAEVEVIRQFGYEDFKNRLS